MNGYDEEILATISMAIEQQKVTVLQHPNEFSRRLLRLYPFTVGRLDWQKFQSQIAESLVVQSHASIGSLCLQLQKLSTHYGINSDTKIYFSGDMMCTIDLVMSYHDVVELSSVLFD